MARQNRGPQLKLNEFGYWEVHWTSMGRSKRRSTGQANKADAERCIPAVMAGVAVGVQVPWPAVAGKMLDRARTNGTKRGREIAITKNDVLSLLETQGYRCAVSGINLDPKPGVKQRNPWAASLDRIDNSKGYVLGNVRIVCVAANLAMNNWGYDTLLALARSMVQKEHAENV